MNGTGDRVNIPFGGQRNDATEFIPCWTYTVTEPTIKLKPQDPRFINIISRQWGGQEDGIFRFCRRFYPEKCCDRDEE